MSTVLAVGLVLEQEVLTPTLLGGRADESGALTSVAQCDAEVLSLDKSALCVCEAGPGARGAE